MQASTQTNQIEDDCQSNCSIYCTPVHCLPNCEVQCRSPCERACEIMNVDVKARNCVGMNTALRNA